MVIWINMEMIHLMNNMNKWIALLVAYCTCILAYSQSISVESCVLAEDNTAKSVETQVLDQNGERCALLKIRTTETGFSFDVGSLGIIKALEQPNEIWLYVPYGIKKMSINHPKYENLKDYQFPLAIRSGRTYVISLDLKRNYGANMGGLKIASIGTGADVYVDGHKIGTTPMDEVEVPVGNHRLMAKLHGWSLLNDEVVISDGKCCDVKLEFNKNMLITSSLISCISNCTWVGPFHNNKAAITKNSKERVWEHYATFAWKQLVAIIDKNGTFIKQYDDIDWNQIVNDGSSEKVNELYNDFKYEIKVNQYASYFYKSKKQRKLGLSILKLNGKVGYNNPNGKIMIPCIYDNGNDFSENLASVCVNGKWGFINKNGDIEIDCIFDDAHDFSEGYAFVKSHGKWGFIDKKGNLLTPFIYSNCDESEFHEGMAVVRIGDKWGYVNQYGNDTFQ